MQEAPNGELSEAAKEENKSANRIRQGGGQTIAPLKTPRNPPHPPPPLHTFEQTITATLSLHIFKTTL
jgi:hypothetical protein